MPPFSGHHNPSESHVHDPSAGFTTDCKTFKAWHDRVEFQQGYQDQKAYHPHKVISYDTGKVMLSSCSLGALFSGARCATVFVLRDVLTKVAIHTSVAVLCAWVAFDGGIEQDLVDAVKSLFEVLAVANMFLLGLHLSSTLGRWWHVVYE